MNSDPQRQACRELSHGFSVYRSCNNPFTVCLILQPETSLFRFTYITVMALSATAGSCFQWTGYKNNWTLLTGTIFACCCYRVRYISLERREEKDKKKKKEWELDLNSSVGHKCCSKWILISTKPIKKVAVSF